MKHYVPGGRAHFSDSFYLFCRTKYVHICIVTEFVFSYRKIIFLQFLIIKIAHTSPKNNGTA